MSSITVLEISTTFRDGTYLVGGSMLKCQCGWYGRLKACPELQIKNYSGGLVKQQFLCRNCLHILTDFRHEKPIKFEDLPAFDKGELEGAVNIRTRDSIKE